MAEIKRIALAPSFGFSVFEIADYFLSTVATDYREEITHLKLQKLVYYAQGATLGIYSRPLFQEKIQAWIHGPVCPVLYAEYRGVRNIKRLDGVQRNKARNYIRQRNMNVALLLDEVWNTFGKCSGNELERMTHQEEPWLNAISHGLNTVISHVELYKYFRQFRDK